MKGKRNTITAVVALALCGGSGVARAAPSEDQLEMLNQQIKMLQDNVRELQQKQDAAAKAAVATPANVLYPNATPAGFIAVPGTDTSVRFGGAVMLEGMFDVGQKGPEGTIAAGVAVNSPNAASAVPYRKGYTRFSAKYTQLEFESRTALQDGKTLKAFVAMDFAGTTTANPVVQSSTNAYVPRLREAYLTYGNWLVGQTAPIFADPASITEPLDAGLHHSGMNLNRMPQITYTYPVDSKTKLAASLVGPASSYTTWNNTQESEYDAGTQGARAMSTYPDLNLAATYEDTWGHVMAHGMGRSIRANDSVVDSDVFGWGVGLTGHFNVPLGATDITGGTSRINYGGNYGDGIANYITDLGYQGAVLDNTGRLHTVKALGYYTGYTQVWDSNWRSSVRWSESRSDKSPLLNSTAAAAWNTRLGLFGVNTVYQHTPKWKYGVEWEWQGRKVQDGSDGHSSRWVAFTKLSF